MLKKPTSKDWHRADIIAAVRKSGTSIQALSFKNGYRRTTLGMALVHPYPKCERIIAAHLGITPQKIWPSRYNEDGTPKRKRGLGRYKRKTTSPTNKGSNPHKGNSSTVKKPVNVNVHA